MQILTNKFGNIFINVLKKMNQNKFTGQVHFINYDNYLKLINFIEKSNKLKLKYIVPYSNESITYYRNVEISLLSKTEKGKDGILSETIEIDFTSLWYITESTEYEISKEDDEIRWDFRWDSRFLSNNSNAIEFDNNGHIPSRVLIEIEGYILNPIFKVEQDGKVLFELPINVTIEIGEKLIFSTIENNFFIKKVNMITNEETELYTLDNIDFDKDYILTLPKGKSILTILTDDILNQATVNIYTYYKAV